MKSSPSENSIDFSLLQYHVYPSLPHIQPYSFHFYSENDNHQTILKREKQLIFESLQYEIFYQF
jgi:hypothetical protein